MNGLAWDSRVLQSTPMHFNHLVKHFIVIDRLAAYRVQKYHAVVS